MSPFATLLTRYRTQRGWSNYDLGRAAGVDPSHCHRLQHDQRPPTAPMVRVLARALALDAAETDRLLLAGGFAPPWLVALAGVARITPKGVAHVR